MRNNSRNGKTPHLTQADSQQLTELVSLYTLDIGLDKHSSSRRAHHVSKDVKRMSLEEAESFTSD